MICDIKGKVDQLCAGAPLSNGDYEYLRISKMGSLFTADWAVQLALAGRVFSLDLGTAGTELAGNAAIDADQPEFVVSVNSGWLIPVELNLGVSGDFDAEEGAQVLVVGDRTNGEAVLTATAETPLNLLDGGEAFSGSAYSVVTGNMTITEADILYDQSFKSVHLQVDSSGTIAINAVINVDHAWKTPVFLAGPCQIAGYASGTATATAFTGRFTFAHLPASWVTVS